MKPPSISLGAAVVSLLNVYHVTALTYDLTARKREPIPRLGRRAIDMSGSFGNGSTALTNAGDLSYYTNITLNGVQFNVQIDTGSSDLWVIGDVPGAQDTGFAAGVQYAVGAINGSVKTATMQLDEFSISAQAYISVPADPAVGQPGTGLIGFGPNFGSQVLDAFSDNLAGDPPLDRIFRQNTSTPNFITLLLSRTILDATNPVMTAGGQLTIGAIAQGYENITSQPKVPALKGKLADQHWQALLDPNGVIGPDGQRVKTTSIVSQKDSSQLNVVFDSGYSLPPVPKAVADAFYSRIPGSTYAQADAAGNAPHYVFPCTYELNVSFVFGGVEQPIHPLDMGYPDPSDPTGKNCISTFQEIPSDLASGNGLDAVLGDAYLRNVYTLINFGDFVDGVPDSVADPYIQLLPITDRAQAHKEFVQERLGGVDTTGSQPALGASVAPPAPPQSTTDKARDFIKRRGTIIAIIAGSIGGLLFFCGLIRFCVSRRRSRPAAYRPLYTPPKYDPNAYNRYAPEPQTFGAGYREPQYSGGYRR